MVRVRIVGSPVAGDHHQLLATIDRPGLTEALQRAWEHMEERCDLAWERDEHYEMGMPVTFFVEVCRCP